MGKIGDIVKRSLYIVGVAVQGLMIINSLINYFIYLQNSAKPIDPFTIRAFFVPCNRYLESGSIIEIFVLLAFIVISIVLYIFASRDLLNRKNRNSAFIILNTFWFLISYSVVFIFMNPDEINVLMSSEGFILSMLELIPSFLLLLMLICKGLDQKNLRRKEPDPTKEEFLPENFQMRSISYRQIKRTAMGTPVIAAVCFLLCLYIRYLNGLLVAQTINFLYALSAIFIVIIFIGTIVECRSFEKRTGQKPPTENFLKKLNIVQIVSFILFALTYILFVFII